MGSVGPGLLQRLTQVEADERQPLWWSAAAFFCVLCSYMILRPVRDAMGIAAGVENLKWLFTATFFGMLIMSPLFALLTTRLGRRRFVPWLYQFFAANLLLFFVALRALPAEDAAVAKVLYVWISVFNLFVVSVFWGLMADVFTRAQGRRLFGVIAGGGSLGALVGPALTALLVDVVGVPTLLLISLGLLEAAIWCLGRRLRLVDATDTSDGDADAPLGGSTLEGITLIVRSPFLLAIAGYTVLTSLTGTFLYFEQAHLVRAHVEGTEARTALFARMDLTVNILALLAQVFIVGRVVRWLGLGLTLALLPVACAVGFTVLGAHFALWPIIVFQVAQRAVGFGTAVPAKEMLFTSVSQRARYKAKNVLDTVVLRGADVANGWLFAGLKSVLTLPVIALVAVPISLLWAALAWRLGRRESTAAAA